jgi:hypothetical protein
MRWLFSVRQFAVFSSAFFSLAFTALLGAGCDKTIYRSHESQYCSSTEDDEPYYECSRSSDLVCINTYEKSYPQTDNRPDKVVKMWLCREACDPTVKNPCRGSDEICCSGQIYGKDYGRKHACVQRELCDSMLGVGPPKDAGAKTDTSSPTDTGASSDVAGEAGSAADAAEADAGAADAPQD